MKKFLPLFLIVLSFSLSACYINDEIGTNQIGVKLDKNKIQEIVGPGVYSEALCFWCDLKAMDVDTQTFSVEDPEVLTSDSQAVGVKITIQARRKPDDESVKNIFTNWSALTNNEALVTTISATAREGIKNGTREFTLPQLLDDRNGLADAIRSQLELDAQKYSVEIVNVTIENIAPSMEYMAILGETANLKAETDKELRRQELIKQKASNNVLEQQKRVEVAEAQFLAEQAETEVQVEIARRAGEVVSASNQVYADNPQAYRLEQLRLMASIFNDKTVYFLPEGVDLTTILGLPQSVVPIEQVP